LKEWLIKIILTLTDHIPDNGQT